MGSLEVTLDPLITPTMSHGKMAVAGKDEEEERPFNSDLPSDTIQAIGSSSNGIKSVVRAAQKKGNEAAAYIFFTNVPLNIVEASESRPQAIGGKNIRVFYDESLRQLIIKLVGGPHEVAGAQLSRAFSENFFRMGLKQQIVNTSAKRIKEIPRSKEPDDSWKPLTLPPARSSKWPTLVVECGWSESLNRLRLDAEWWLAHSRGDVGVVVLVSVDRKEPKITLETWIIDPTSRALLHTMCSQVVTISRDQQNAIITVGAPLVIEFEKTFLRPANPPLEHDITVSQQELEFLATVTWNEAGI